MRDAFGSVSHRLLEHNLIRMNFSENVRKVVMNSHNGARVRILSWEGWIDEIPIRRGMKQGCPLSPLLFNSCLDPLIRKINEDIFKSHGFPINDDQNMKWSCQAYADDLLLFSNSDENW
jgi:hypothetical protein